MPLITTIDEIRKYVAIDINADIENLNPYIEDAQNTFIKDLMGSAELNVIQTDYDDASGDPDLMTADNKAILGYIQRALAHYALYLAANDLSVSIGNIGIVQGQTSGSSPVQQSKVDKLEAQWLKSGDKDAENLLEFLETTATISIYASWYANNHTRLAGSLIPNTRIASLYIDIGESRRMFLRLKKYIQDVENKHIKRLVCKTEFDNLVTAIKSGSETADQNALIAVLRPIICKKALYLALPTLQVGVTDEGIHLFSSTNGAIRKEVASDSRVQLLMRSLREGEFGFNSDHEEAIKFIDDNIDTYPDIKTSECYTSKADPGPKHEYQNSKDNKHFAV